MDACWDSTRPPVANAKIAATLGAAALGPAETALLGALLCCGDRHGTITSCRQEVHG
jgi:hypothetical protein